MYSKFYADSRLHIGKKMPKLHLKKKRKEEKVKRSGGVYFFDKIRRGETNISSKPGSR